MNRRSYLHSLASWLKEARKPLLTFAVYLVFFLLFFSPVVFGGKVFAFGDALYQNLANYLLPFKLWEPNLFSGFPMSAEPQALQWYPLAKLLSRFPDSWNLFVVLAYTLAASFAHAFVRQVTRCPLAGWIGGFTYGLNGFLMAHLGHTNMIHSAAWLPLILWCLDRALDEHRRVYIVVGAFAVASCATAGHPQILVYSLGLSGAFFVWRLFSVPRGMRLRSCLAAGAIVALGLGLAMVQLLPTSELVKHGLRAQLTYSRFLDHALAPRHIASLLFPYLFGADTPTIYRIGREDVVGKFNFTEQMGYMGLLPFMLFLVAAFSRKERPPVLFWSGVLLTSFLLTLGKLTPLSKLFFHLPGYSSFRGPPRHFLEFGMATAVLAGYGVKLLRHPQEALASRWIRKSVWTVAGMLAVTLLAVLLLPWEFAPRTADPLRALLGSLHLGTPAVWIPLVVFAVGALTLAWWARKPQATGRTAALVSMVVIDLASFGWFYDWQTNNLPKEGIAEPEKTSWFRAQLAGTGERLLTASGAYTGVEDLPPNLSAVWGLPGASGYSPLILRRYHLGMGIGASGEAFYPLLSRHFFDLMRVRYLLISNGEFPTPGGFVSHSINWDQVPLNQVLGSACGPELAQTSLPLPDRFPAATGLGLVTSLACSSEIADGTPVSEVRIHFADGSAQTFTLKAGEHTSETAMGRPDLAHKVQHARAPLFQSISAEEQHYLARLEWNEPRKVARIEVRALDKATIQIHRMSLLTSPGSLAISGGSILLADASSWRPLDLQMGSLVVYENQKPLPAAWLLHEAVLAPPDDILVSIHRGRLPDGRIFNPLGTALIERPLPGHLGLPASSAEPANVVVRRDDELVIETHAQTPALLVMSEIFYPGWRAEVDGTSAPIFPVNYLLRGMYLPEGSHRVRLTFEPASHRRGIAISLLSLAILGAVCVSRRRKLPQG